MFRMFLFLNLFSCLLFAGNDPAKNLLSTNCMYYADTMILSRTSSTGEEQLQNGTYQAFAQQFNLVGTVVKGVQFNARVNPLSGNATNTLKVVLYNVNLGLPGTIIYSQNVVVDSASLCYPVQVSFTNPVNINGNVIIAIEPFSPTTDNFFLQRNTPPDGQNLNLIKIKQGNQWFKNLAAGDPNFDYDFMILPLSEKVVSAAFTSSSNALQVTFNNTSTNANTYAWNFGDGNTSSAANPTHQYASSGTYTVKLFSSRNGINNCTDSTSNTIQISNTGIANNELKNGLMFFDVNASILKFTAQIDGQVIIYDIQGRRIEAFDVMKNRDNQLDLSHLTPGVYTANVNAQTSIKFIKK